MKTTLRLIVILCLMLCMRGASVMSQDSVDIPSVKSNEAIALDGSGQSSAWSTALTLPVLLSETGESEDAQRRSRVRVVRAGRWLLLCVDADEPDGIVARECAHGSDLWFDDAFGIELKGTQSCAIMVNPFGSLWSSLEGKTDATPILNQLIQTAARIDGAHWRAEVAVDLRVLAKDGTPPAQFTARIYRQRQARGLVPFENTAVPQKDALTFKTGASDTGVQIKTATPQRFVEPARFTALRCAAAPADDAAWSKLPVTPLRNEDGRPVFDETFQSTTARAAITPDALVLRVDCREAFPLTDGTEGKELWQQDGLEIFLGPENWGFLQLACNSKGTLAAVRGKTGGKNPKSIPVPEGVRAQAAADANGWTLTLTIPFESTRSAISFPKTLGFDLYPWRIQIGRNRVSRAALGQPGQYSVLAVTQSATAHCPQRFALLNVTDTAAPAPVAVPLEMPAPVLSAEQRKQLNPSTLLEEWLRSRTKEFQRAQEEQFSKMDSADAWNAHAAKIHERLMRAMFPASNGALPPRTPLNEKIVYTHIKGGDGFRVDGLIFESRPGLPVAATIFSPDAPPAAGQLRPVLLMIPAHHTPRNSLDLQIVGMTLARAGGVALATESLGSGERSVSALWEHKSYQCNEVGAQLSLAAEELAGWTAWDISRAVDYLLQRGDIDPKRVGLMGGVAGGGDISALAAAIDERITVSIPFNFNSYEPFGGYWDPCRTYPGSQSGGFSPWMVDALAAPRCQIMAQEFTWGAQCQDRYARFQKVYSLLGVEKNLAFVHGGENTHATHFNVMHRLPVYKILNQWWGTALPESADGEYKTRMSDGELECYTKPEGRKYFSALRADNRLHEPHEIALAQASQALSAAREQRQKSGRTLQEDLSRLLKDIAPTTPADAMQASRAEWSGYKVEALWLPAEPGSKLGLALWRLSPKNDGRRPLVLGVAQAGKAQLLSQRGAEIKKLLEGGVAVTLLDVRGCGETSPGASRCPEGASITLASVAWMQEDSLPARQLKDVRTALRYLTTRNDVDADRVGLWGEGLTPPNGKATETILFDETGFRQVSPTPKNFAEPLGGWLAMTAALYPIDLGGGRSLRPRAVLARGALVSFATMLERRYFYVPEDAFVPGILNVAEMSDIAAALRKDNITLLAEDLRDGSNRSVDSARVQKEWQQPPPSSEADSITTLVNTLKK